MKKNKGITLIALVITIIVMLILVGVTISMAVNGGLFKKAGEAVRDTNTQIEREGELADGGVKVNGVWYNTIDEYLNRDKETTGTTLLSLWEADKLNVGDYVDYNPNTGITTVNPDNPKNEENVAVGALTGYGEAAQSVAYESLKWRVLGYDETKDEILLISATPTTAGLNFYGHVGYNNYEGVLETVCNKLYSNTSIGATARSITMDDIDTYLGGSAFTKTTYEGGSNTAGGYGYTADIYSRFQIDEETGNLSLVADEGTVTLEDLTSTAYRYTTSSYITDATKLELLQGSNSEIPYYYWVASRAMLVDSSNPYWGYADWCLDFVIGGDVRADYCFCYSLGVENRRSFCVRPVVSLPSAVTTEQVPVLETVPTVNWNDPLEQY